MGEIIFDTIDDTGVDRVIQNYPLAKSISRREAALDQLPASCNFGFDPVNYRTRTYDLHHLLTMKKFSRMRDILKLARVQIAVGVLFIVLKVTRPSILENNPPEFVKIFLLSFPNFCEAVIGVMTLTMIGILVNRKKKWADSTIYIAATVSAAVFVITQELKIHNLGGNNTYDPNDLIFSIAGLMIGFILLLQMKPSIQSGGSGS